MITKIQNIMIVLLAFSGTALYAADNQLVVERTAKKSSARKRYEARLGRRQSKQQDGDQQPQQPAKKKIKKIKKSKKERVVKKSTEQAPQKSIRAERLAKKRAQAAERKKKAAQAQEQVQQKVTKRPVRRRKQVAQPESSMTEKPVKKQQRKTHRRATEKKHAVMSTPANQYRQHEEESGLLAERVNRLIAYVQHKEEERAAREQYKQLQKQSYRLQRELGY